MGTGLLSPYIGVTLGSDTLVLTQKKKCRISFASHTAIHFTRNDSLTAQRYHEEILQPIGYIYAATIDPKLIFMDNNVCTHCGNTVKQWFEKEGIEQMELPAC